MTKLKKQRMRNKGVHAGKPASFIEDVVQQIDHQNIVNFGGEVPPDPGAVDRMAAHDAEREETPSFDDGAEKPKPSSSVVHAKFKKRYTENAREQGIKGKAARRSNWDWLSQQIASYCLNPKGVIDMDRFIAILQCNGIDHNRWPNRAQGWQGRLRMTGRVTLQRIVADAKLLKMPDSTELAPPADFVD